MSRLTRAAAAEWLKLRTVRSTWWFVGGALLMMVAVAALNADGTANDLDQEGGAPGSVDAASAAVTAVGWVHLVLGALGVLAMTSEYATRSILVTLACTPSRITLLMAKAVVVSTAVFAAGVPLAVLGVAASAPVLGRYASFDAGQVAGQVVAIGVDLALIAVLALGLGAVIRRSAGALTVLFALLLVVPTLLDELADPLGAGILRTLADHTPAIAGDRFMNGEPAFGLALVAWAVAALAAGAWALRVRDA